MRDLSLEFIGVPQHAYLINLNVKFSKAVKDR